MVTILSIDCMAAATSERYDWTIFCTREDNKYHPRALDRSYIPNDRIYGSTGIITDTSRQSGGTRTWLLFAEAGHSLHMRIMLTCPMMMSSQSIGRGNGYSMAIYCFRKIMRPPDLPRV
eukprot:scaffold41796_cov51-Attheya_sp.AAC.6